MSGAERVAVIGAGLAGLAAARRLAAEGREVVVFDKARGAGGRTSTRRSDGGAFDHGAQYFTCRSDRFREQLDAWLGRGVAARWDAKLVELRGGQVGAVHGEAERYVGTPRMSMLARDLAAGLALRTSARAVSADRDAIGWSLSFEDGASEAGFDSLVVATPAPQAVPLLSGVPELAASAAAVEMQACHAAMVTFETRPPFDFDGAFVADSPVAWAARNASKPERADEECWVLHSAPEWSAQSLEESPEAVADALLRAFEEAAGTRLPATRWLASHRWLLARASEPLGRSPLWDTDARVGVCGDWLVDARVEAAFLSGDALAAAMLG